MDAVMALAASVFGVGTLFAAWRRSRDSNRLLVAGGWAIIAAAVVLWARAAGAEFGTVYAMLALAATAWLVAGTFGRERRPAAERRPQVRVIRDTPTRASVIPEVARAVVAVPLAGMASLLLSVLLVVPLPWQTTNRYVFAIMIAPVIWGLLATWASLTTRLRFVALCTTGVAAASAALLFVR